MSELTYENRVWHSGPPPHVGWWNASTTGMPDRWRWWNGSHWSKPAHSGTPAESAKWRAAGLENHAMQVAMKWSDYWPEGARVPRVNPETGESTGFHAGVAA